MKRKRKQESMRRDRDNAMASFRPLSQYRSYRPAVGDSYIDGFKDATGWSEDEIMDYTNPARDVVDWDDYDEGFEDGLSALETVGEPLPEKRKRNADTRKQDNLIEIPEDVRVPGTDVILEAGDTVEVSSKSKIKEVSSLKRAIQDYVGPGDRRYNSGFSLADVILDVVSKMTDPVQYEEFLDGMKDVIENELYSVRD